ncbi:MAG: hypothetical protein QNI96_05100 [Woeseiaceae bacterium]|nr:hypothetical protein [Woeseiaceae bacterium]
MNLRTLSNAELASRWYVSHEVEVAVEMANRFATTESTDASLRKQLAKVKEDLSALTTHVDAVNSQLDNMGTVIDDTEAAIESIEENYA